MKVALFIAGDFFRYADISDGYTLDIIKDEHMNFLRTKFFIPYQVTNEDFTQSKDNPIGEYIRVYQYGYITP